MSQNILDLPKFALQNTSAPPVQMPSDFAVNSLKSVSSDLANTGKIFLNIQDEHDRNYFLSYQNEIIKYNSEFQLASANLQGSNAAGLSKKYSDGLEKIHSQFSKNVNEPLRKEINTFYQRESSSGKTKYGLYEVQQADVDTQAKLKNLVNNLQTNSFVDITSYENNLILASSHIFRMPGISEEQKTSLVNASINSISESALKGYLDRKPFEAIEAFKEGKFTFTGTSLISATNYVRSVEGRLVAEIKAKEHEHSMNLAIEKQSVQLEMQDYLRASMPIPMELMDKFRAYGASGKELERVMHANENIVKSYEDFKIITSTSLQGASAYVESLKEDPIRYKKANEELHKYQYKINNDPVNVLKEQISDLVNNYNINIGDATYNLQKEKGLNEAKIRFFSKEDSAEIKNQLKNMESGSQKFELVNNIAQSYGERHGQSALREVVKPEYSLAYTLVGKNKNVASRYFIIVDEPLSNLVKSSDDEKKIKNDVFNLSNKKNNILSYLQQNDLIYGTNKYYDTTELIAKYSAKYNISAKDAVNEIGDIYGGDIYADKEIVAARYNVSDFTYKAKRNLVNRILRDPSFSLDQLNSLRKGAILSIDGAQAIIANSAGIPFKVFDTSEVMREEERLRKIKKIIKGKKEVAREELRQTEFRFIE